MKGTPPLDIFNRGHTLTEDTYVMELIWWQESSGSTVVFIWSSEQTKLASHACWDMEQWMKLKVVVVLLSVVLTVDWQKNAVFCRNCECTHDNVMQWSEWKMCVGVGLEAVSSNDAFFIKKCVSYKFRLQSRLWCRHKTEKYPLSEKVVSLKNKFRLHFEPVTVLTWLTFISSPTETVWHQYLMCYVDLVNLLFRWLLLGWDSSPACELAGRLSDSIQCSICEWFETRVCLLFCSLLLLLLWCIEFDYHFETTGF